MINELPSSGCRGPRAPDRQVVFTVRSLDLAVPLILDQLLSVFPARRNLFRTNGPAVFQCSNSSSNSAISAPKLSFSKEKLSHYM